MIDIKADIWDFHKLVYPICITTNGCINSSGNLVMGKGIAKEAKDRFPDLPKILANMIINDGNNVHYIGKYGLFSFPTKHNWWEKSDIDLIIKSAKQLITWSDFNYIGLPRPGCGNGGLQWSYVKPILDEILDNRYLAFHN
jgi:hypothetical protein